MQQVLPAFLAQLQMSLQTTVSVFIEILQEAILWLDRSGTDMRNMPTIPSAKHAPHVLLTLLRVCSRVCLESVRIDHSIV